MSEAKRTLEALKKTIKDSEDNNVEPEEVLRHLREQVFPNANPEASPGTPGPDGYEQAIANIREQTKKGKSVTDTLTALEKNADDRRKRARGEVPIPTEAWPTEAVDLGEPKTPPPAPSEEPPVKGGKK